MEWDAVFQEVAALVSVYPDALHACAIRHEGGQITAVVSGGQLCVKAGAESANDRVGGGTSAPLKDDGVLIDVAALEECLNAAVGRVAAADADAEDADDSETSWLSDWVESLGPGISLLCMVSPEECTGDGIPVHVLEASQHENSTPIELPHVRYLPPLRVTVHCTAEYPDMEPALEVYAPWLEKEAVEQVVLAMRAAATEQGEGSPVMLTWLECAKKESAQSLETVTVRPGCGSSVVRSLPECPPMLVEAEQPPDVEGVLALLRAHDLGAREAAFAAELLHCAICLDHHPGANGIKPPCGHWHCTECMREMAITFMHASDPTSIRCPQPDCRAQLDPETLQELLNAEQMARWDSLMLQRALAKMSDVVFCPRCEVAAVENAEWAMCPGCNYAFCALCYGSYHPGVQCATPEEKLRLLDERSRRMEGTDNIYTAKEMVEHRKLRQQLADEALVRKATKGCPHCGAAIQKTAGCNKVVCAFCKGAMCWLCNAAIEGYEHFRTAACKLIDEAQAMEWEREWDRLQAVHNPQLIPVHVGVHGQVARAVLGMRCLQCGQFCIKVANNNHIRCVWCAANCCFACNTLLRGRRAVKEHFRGNKCPQHS